MIKQSTWTKLEYSRTKVINAGKTVKKTDATRSEMDEALKVVDNWRAAHAFPLHIVYMHLRRMAEERTDIIVAERLKRLDSIINKLKREATMNLWTMQDLGGCRFIVPTIEEVYKYSGDFKTSRIRHLRRNEIDYIQDPKVSGYRSLHLVYEYHSDKKEEYNRNHLIEIQFRTHLQHIWATAVETMGLFTKQAIKAGKGSADVNRFFVLTSSLIAIKENTPIVPNTVDRTDDLVSEIKKINDKHNYLEKLSAIRVAVDSKESQLKKQGYYILVLNYNSRMLRIIYFKPSESKEASEVYQQIETTEAESKNDAVLVRVASFKQLRSAYPNYFSDIGEFVEIVEGYLK